MKVISGGQTGADQAGLRAAKACGIETGGWLPKGCITLDGPCPQMLEEYGMQEHHRSGYPARTEANVKDSDATIRFAKFFGSAGERCTHKAISWYNRPYIDVDIRNPIPVEEVVEWLLDKKVKTLNVAGNSEATAPGIGEFVYNYLIEVFTKLRLDSQQEHQ